MMVPLDPKEVERLARLTHRQRSRAPNVQALLTYLEPRVGFVREQWASVGGTWPDITPAMVHVTMTEAYRGAGYGGVDGSRTFFDLIFSQLMCRRSKDPIWALDEDCARALAETDPPFDVVSDEVMEGRLRLPFPGMYLALPPVFTLHDPASGDHAVEGIYLADAWTLPITRAELEQYGSALEARRCHAPVRGMMVVGVGRAKGTYGGSHGAPEINDTLRSVMIGPKNDLRQYADDEGFANLVRLSVNFLLALNAHYLDVQEVRPVPPKSAHKAQMRERRGELMERHTRVRLGKRAVPASSRRTTGLSAVERAASLVRGHWHHYWVSDPGEEIIVSIKPGKGGVLHLVAKWLLPYERGPGDPKGPNYRVSGAPDASPGGEGPCG